MCQSEEASLGRTQPDPRKPSNFSASEVPAWTHASISLERDGSTWRVTDTVTGADMSLSLRHPGAPGEAGDDEIPATSEAPTWRARRTSRAGIRQLPDVV